MPDFVPCKIVGPDVLVHLHSPNDPATALCGQPVDEPTPAVGDRNVCAKCARRLVKHIMKLAGSGGIGSIEVTVKPPTQDDGLL